jgi:tRNA 5-methylaminomethyl-2-thiouridine biosynthesis bifunctional protein
MTLRSEEFDDIYFSPEDGVAETEYVFLAGNNLPAAWQDKPYFTICETGFGTGLNFLTTWECFENSAVEGQHLHYISFEKHPLTTAVIKTALQPWTDRFAAKIESLCEKYPLRIAGWRRIEIAPNISLTLIFDDINHAIPHLNTSIDAWYLDGFAPSKNPDMWREELFTAMKRCALSTTSVATFTAAGLVNRGLSEHGFSVTKQNGFGRKREMITAIYSGATKRKIITPKRNQKIAIIGGGLGGCAAAHHLDKAGHDVTLFEKESGVAQKASGNMLGLYNPRFRKQLDGESLFYSSAFAHAHSFFEDFTTRQGHDIGYKACGALHVAHSEQKQGRFKAMLKNWAWHDDHLRWVDKKDSEAICGIKLEHDALYTPDSGYVSPRKLCAALMQNIEIKTLQSDLSSEVLKAQGYDAVILASGTGFAAFDEFGDVELSAVRGQITAFSTQPLPPLKTVLCFSGYVTPPLTPDNDENSNPVMYCGSTFQPWSTDEQCADIDDQDNIDQVNSILPAEHKLQAPEIIDRRAGLRTTSRDHFPVIGPLDSAQVYCSTAHGSHGLISSLLGAVILNDLISYGHVTCQPQNSMEKLNPRRYLKG